MEYMSTDSDNKEEIDLLLADFNISEVIDMMENLYPNRDLPVYERSLITLCQEPNKNEERAESLLFSRREVSLLSSVKYGTVEDLLAFANQVSNTAKQFCRPRKQESGIILNMVGCFLEMLAAIVITSIDHLGSPLDLLRRLQIGVSQDPGRSVTDVQSTVSSHNKS